MQIVQSTTRTKLPKTTARLTGQHNHIRIESEQMRYEHNRNAFRSVSALDLRSQPTAEDAIYTHAR